jgi:hypothetical protein
MTTLPMEEKGMVVSKATQWWPIAPEPKKPSLRWHQNAANCLDWMICVPTLWRKGPLTWKEMCADKVSGKEDLSAEAHRSGGFLQRAQLPVSHIPQLTGTGRVSPPPLEF